MKKLVFVVVIFTFISAIAETNAHPLADEPMLTIASHDKEKEATKTEKEEKTLKNKDSDNSVNSNSNKTLFDQFKFFTEMMLKRSWEFPSSQTISIHRT